MKKINQLRKRIDELDDQILDLLSERAELSVTIGLLKKKEGVPVRVLSRENEVLMKIQEKAITLDLDPAKVEVIYNGIISMCTSLQERKKLGKS